MALRLRASELHRAGVSPVMTDHKAIAPAPIKDCLADPGFFNACRDHLRPGDRVEMVRVTHPDLAKARVIEFCERVMIVSKDARGIAFRQMAPIVTLYDDDIEPVADQPEDTGPTLEVIPSDTGAGFMVRNIASGNVEKTFKSKSAAERYAKDYGKAA